MDPQDALLRTEHRALCAQVLANTALTEVRAVTTRLAILEARDESQVSVEHPYWEWIRAEAEAIQADGCSGVTEFRQICCFEHDVAYHHGRDPRAAYRLARSAHPYPWAEAPRISKLAVDGRFWRCHEQRSKFRWFSPVAAYRFAGVVLFAGGAWDRHRALRP